MKYFIACLIILLTTSVHSQEGPIVTMHTNFGTIVLEMKREQAPKTVDNFLRYVKEGFYEGTIFHRVIRGFVIQGGGYTEDYEKKLTHPSIPNESENGLENERGTIAMARGSYDSDSATSQFFINVNNNQSLNYQSSSYSNDGYTVFGQVIQGMEVVDKIQKVRTSAAGHFRRYVPKKPVIIESIMAQNTLLKQPLAENDDDDTLENEIAEDILSTHQEEDEETTDSMLEIKTLENEKTLDNSNSASTALSVDEIEEETPVISETENAQVEEYSRSETITAEKNLLESTSQANAVLPLDDLDDNKEDTPVLAETENDQAYQEEADSTIETSTENILEETSSVTIPNSSGIKSKTETLKTPRDSHIDSIPLGEKTLTDNSQARLAYVTEMGKNTQWLPKTEKEKFKTLEISKAYPFKTAFSAPDSPSTPDKPEALSD